MDPPRGLRGLWTRLFAPSIDLELEVDTTADYEILVVRPKAGDDQVFMDRLERPRLVAVRGRYARLSRASRKLLDSLREYAPCVVEGGFLFTKRQLPDVLQHLRTKRSVKETSGATAVKIAPPLTPAFAVQRVDERTIQVEARFESSDPLSFPETRYTPEEVNGVAPGEWLHKGAIFQRSPAELSKTARLFTGSSTPTILTDDEVPFFLVRQLKELERSGRVYLDPRVRAVRVVEADFLPKVSLDVEGSWLWIDPKYLVGGYSVPYTDVEAVEPGRRYLRQEDAWIRVDRETHKNIRATFKDFGRVLQREGDRFRAPASYAVVIQEALAQVGRVDLSEAFHRFKRRLEDFTAIEPVPVPAALQGKLRRYQQHGLNWLAFLRDYGLNGILADDMGLGKTRQALALLQHVKEKRGSVGALIVCPTSVVDVWLKEMKEELALDLFPFRYTGSGRSRFFTHPEIYDVVVTTYDTLRRDTGDLGRIVWDYVILDEAQKIKNPETSTAKSCKALLAQHKLALSGTPIENRLAELWSIFDFLMPGYLGNYGQFREHFEVPIMKSQSRAAGETLKRRIDPFKLRRLKSDVAKDLPRKINMDRYCQLTSEQVELYRYFVGQERGRLEREITTATVKLTSPSILAAITRLKQICCHPELVRPRGGTVRDRSGKFEAFVEALEEALESGNRVLVFSQYVEMCALLRRYFDGEGIRYSYLDGGTPAARRREVVEEFQHDSGPAVFLISLRAGGLGINLTRANTVIHYDRWWNPAVEAQAEDRAHRIGQSETVTVFRIHTEGTIEEKLDRLQKRKRALFEEIIEPDELAKEISREELLELLSFD